MLQGPPHRQGHCFHQLGSEGLSHVLAETMGKPTHGLPVYVSHVPGSTIWNMSAHTLYE